MVMRSSSAAAAAAALGLATGLAFAQAYPSKPVRLIAPFPPGGTSDVLSRLLAQRLSDALGRQVVVENRPGAGSNLGHELAAKAPADGYTMLLSSNTALAANRHLYKRLGFDPDNDFAPISIVARSGPVLVVHPSVPAKSVAELVALAKARPGQLNFGSGGRGTPAHYAGEILKSAAHVNIVHVPYKGGILAVNDTLGGQIEMMFADMAPAVPHIRTGRLRALAVATPQRSAALPEVPTLAQAGIKEPVPETWWALVMPKGAPEAAIARISTELEKIMQLADIKERYASLGIATVHTTPAQVSESVKVDSARIGKALKEAGVQPE
jgi:tripartite-type tricarboxylate transporter receptor subunit TctC